MRIAEGVIEQVRDRSDIVEVVRDYVPNLKVAGRNHKACCPFHQERTPSFNVNPEKQIFHCFGCGAGGDVFTFVMKIEGLAFLEAVQKLGERAGVKVAPDERDLSPADRQRLSVRRANEAQRDRYRDGLKKLPEAEPARAVLAKRGVSPEMAEAFGLGYAPKTDSFMFRGRLMFPIRNGKGETVAFGGRILGPGEPKYINSAESEIFSKRKTLYGLHEGLAALRKERRAIVLEGYMDVIAAHQFGFTNAVAPLGTALTEDHAAVLKRWVDGVTIVFDPDAAGSTAAVKGAELLLEKGFSVSVATVPDALDPDELLHQRGAEAFQAVLDAAVDLAEFKTRTLLAKYKGPLSAEDKAKVAGLVLETIRKCPDDVVKGEWLRRLAQLLAVNEESLYSQLARGAEAGPEARRRPAPAAARPSGAPLPTDDREVLLALLRAPGTAGLVAEGDFADPRARAVFARLTAVLAEGRAKDALTGRLLEGLDDAAAAVARELLCDGREVRDAERLVAEVVGRGRKARRLKELEPLVLGAAGGGAVDPGLKDEYRRLLADLKGTKRG